MCKYLDQCVVCDDSACRKKTRACSVFGRQCLVKGCKGFVRFEYSDSQLYTQMQYYEHILSINKYRDKLQRGDEVMKVIEENKDNMEKLSSLLDRYLKTSSRRFVDLAQIFNFGS
jgi:DNA polymerase alpha subunit A